MLVIEGWVVGKLVSKWLASMVKFLGMYTCTGLTVRVVDGGVEIESMGWTVRGTRVGSGWGELQRRTCWTKYLPDTGTRNL